MTNTQNIYTNTHGKQNGDAKSISRI